MTEQIAFVSYWPAHDAQEDAIDYTIRHHQQSVNESLSNQRVSNDHHDAIGYTGRLQSSYWTPPQSSYHAQVDAIDYTTRCSQPSTKTFQTSYHGQEDAIEYTVNSTQPSTKPSFQTTYLGQIYPIDYTVYCQPSPKPLFKFPKTLEIESSCNVKKDLYRTYSTNVAKNAENISSLPDYSLDSASTWLDDRVDGNYFTNSNHRDFISRNMHLENVVKVFEKESVTIPCQRTRIRQRGSRVDPSKWKRNSQKHKMQQGEPYLSAKGILKPGKMLKESKCFGLCREKCGEKFSEKERLEIFSLFWNIVTTNQKREYIIGLISREQTQNKKKIKVTNKYYLKKLGLTEKQQVCQKFFLATFNISETFVRSCFKKLTTDNDIEDDMRGKHRPHNKKSVEIRQIVKKHIMSLNQMPVQSFEMDKIRKHLIPDLNLVRMYEHYKIKCKSWQIEPVEISYYRSVFKTDFNIGFYKTRKDMCNKCYHFKKLTADNKEKERGEHEKHLEKEIIARQHRDKAKKWAQCGLIHFAEYEFEPVCNCPSSSSDQMIYYSCRIPVYNFTMLDFDREKRNVYCFCWHDAIGRKGAVEIGSCLLKYLQNKADGRPVTFMSNSCASQCRNMYISALLLYCIESYDIPEINQKYFEPGHSQLEINDVHAIIKHAKKKQPIFHPSHFYSILRKVSETCPYNVCEMRREDFKNLKELRSTVFKNCKVDCSGNIVNWLKIRWLQYRKKDSEHIYFKYDLDNDTEFRKIKVIRRGDRKNVNNILLKHAYDRPLPISAGKYRELQEMCKLGIIPVQFHEFYESLTVKPSTLR